MHFARLLIWCGILGVLCCAKGNSAIGKDAAKVLTVKKASVGFGGKFKAGFWQPLLVTVAAGPSGARGRLDVVVPDGDQMPARFMDARRGELNLAAGEER